MERQNLLGAPPPRFPAIPAPRLRSTSPDGSGRSGHWTGRPTQNTAGETGFVAADLYGRIGPWAVAATS
uniref:Uncharacterized protein n=1 Tax=Aegilops tauschii TaxID=37682 RepID=R7W6D8_AEGTA